jgi:prevent-host-death family protein
MKVEAVGMSEARNSFASLVKGTESGHRYLVHNKGTPKVVIIGIDEYRDMETTLQDIEATEEELGDPESLKLAKAGEEDIKHGRTRSIEEILGEALL